MENTRKSSRTGERPRVVLGVTGGIAAYKSPVLARLLAAEADVRVVMTCAAQRFVGPLTFTALTSRPALTEMFDPVPAGPVAHITEAQDADLVVVAPATADFLARTATGRADDLLGAMLLVSRAPILLAPSMNTRMWEHPATQRNLATVCGDGRVHVVGPQEGDLACGWTGPGRMADPQDIFARALALLTADAPLSGKHVLVTAGPTEEPLDPVRVLTNRSSGRMGRAIAHAAVSAGARVTLVRGPVAVDDPPGVDVVAVRTTDEMCDQVVSRLGETDALVMAAAVADYRPRRYSRSKLRKSDTQDGLHLDLVKTQDILASCARARKGKRPLIVGFSLETDGGRAVKTARAKLRAKGCDLVVSNVASTGLGGQKTVLHLVAPRVRARKVGPVSKPEAAEAIIDWIAPRL